VNGWTIHKGKLYMNFNAEINDTFAARADGFIQDAESHWPRLNR
jgi:hypothetical protein